MRTTMLILAGLATASAAIVLPTTVSSTPGSTPTRATAIDPADFTSPKANAYFPLRPGTTTILRGHDEGERLRERVHVTFRTRTIQGVQTRVVRDVVRRKDGTIAEKTVDWYAADNAGSVWYFGERTATFDEDGELESREGSWQAGRDGAVAGMIMPARPHATQAFRQEFYRGHAEDQAWIVGNSSRTRTPMRTFRHVVRSFEWTRLEPRVISMKLYARGVGIVKEKNLTGGSEHLQVVAVRRP